MRDNSLTLELSVSKIIKLSLSLCSSQRKLDGSSYDLSNGTNKTSDLVSTHQFEKGKRFCQHVNAQVKREQKRNFMEQNRQGRTFLF